MSDIIILIIGSSCLGFSFAEISMIPQMFSKLLLDKFNLGKTVKGYQYIKIPYRLKPFDCGYCLSFWCGLLSALYFDWILIIALMIGFTSSVITILLKKIL